MILKKLDKDYFVSSQIKISDLKGIQQLGIKSIISLRPDNEDQLQPSSCDLLKACQEIGLGFFHVPVTFDNINTNTISTFTNFFNNCNKPTLAFCGAGSRAALLYIIYKKNKSESENKPDIYNAALATCNDNGFELEEVINNLSL